MGKSNSRKENSKIKENDFDSSHLSQNTLEDNLSKWKDEIKKLSYEESLIQLDILLKELQSDDVALDDIQKYYLKGNIYLAHCRQLLRVVEQEIMEINLDQIQIEDNS